LYECCDGPRAGLDAIDASRESNLAQNNVFSLQSLGFIVSCFARKHQAYLFDSLFDLILDPEDGGIMLLRIVDQLVSNYVATLGRLV
jgi:hypothetical protein